MAIRHYWNPYIILLVYVWYNFLTLANLSNLAADIYDNHEFIFCKLNFSYSYRKVRNNKLFQNVIAKFGEFWLFWIQSVDYYF